MLFLLVCFLSFAVPFYFGASGVVVLIAQIQRLENFQVIQNANLAMLMRSFCYLSFNILQGALTGPFDMTTVFPITCYVVLSASQAEV